MSQVVKSGHVMYVHIMTSPCGMTVRPTVTPAMASDTASLRLYCGSQPRMGSRAFTPATKQSVHGRYVDILSLARRYLLVDTIIDNNL